MWASTLFLLEATMKFPRFRSRYCIKANACFSPSCEFELCYIISARLRMSALFYRKEPYGVCSCAYYRTNLFAKVLLFSVYTNYKHVFLQIVIDYISFTMPQSQTCYDFMRHLCHCVRSLLSL